MLRIVMFWQDALHTRYHTAGIVGLKIIAALGFSHLTYLSWTTLVAGTVAAAEIYDRPPVVYVLLRLSVDRRSIGPPAFSISTTDDFCQQLVTETYARRYT
jgi:hypothetical protein